MLPTSHHAPMILPPSVAKGTLAEAFDAFMATAGRMEPSYSQLQGEVARLRRELEERNAALTLSLAENKHIRAALKRILDALTLHIEPSQYGVFGSDQFILILRDVSARKEAEQQRDTSRNMLALGEMAAVLAPEIRNPLCSMEL